MSSSQARLLTLTARLHSIELKAQKHEAEKLRLANDSDRVYETYLAALEQTKLVANVLADDGSMTYIDLTANAIYNYKTLQNQYSLITKDDKMLISSSIANNYKNTNSLSDFLNAYGLQSGFTQTIHHEDPNPTYIDQEARYQNAHKNWENACKAIDDDYNRRHDNWALDVQRYYDSVDDFNRRHEQWVIDHANWVPAEPDETDQTQPWWTVTTDDSLANKFETAGGSCYNSAKTYPGCYAHVLIRMIDFDKAYNASASNFADSSWYSSSANNYTTSTGKSFQLKYSDISGAGISGNATGAATFNEVSQKLNEGVTVGAADGETCDVTASSSEYSKLVSKWNVDGTLKDVKQWAEDLYYVCTNYNSMTKDDGSAVTSSDVSSTVMTFHEALKSSLTEFNEEVYNEYHERWVNSEPPEPTFSGTLPPEPTKDPYPAEPVRDDYVNAPATLPRDEVVNHTTFNDKDKAQWYINVWYRMEGINDTPKVMTEVVHDDANDVDLYIYSCTNKNKSNTTYSTNADWNVEENENYMVIPDDKLNDPKWLRNAVVEGFVLIQEFDKENNNFFDTSVSVTTRIHELQDETGVKKAEAQYEADMKKIDRKDRYYDTEIAKCENERSAIINELDSLKNVAKENVDRTFKLFS